MSAAAEAILTALAEVARERARRGSDAALAHRVTALKQWQQARLARTYADLREAPRYRGAVQFFLDELYGPSDFARRDTQFARVVPGLVRLFPAEVVDTVVALAQLHALSERLDTEMALALPAGEPLRIDDAAYGRAWRQVGQPAERDQQIALLVRVGTALDRHTRSKLLRASLHMMRAPARAAGLEALQRFLETGFDSFGAMGGAKDFMRAVEQRERALAAQLFAGG